MKVRVDDVLLSDGTPSFVGDTVKVLPARHGGHDGYLAVVRRIDQRRDSVEVTVAGVDHVKARDAVRTVHPSRLRKPTAAEIRAAGEKR